MNRAIYQLGHVYIEIQKPVNMKQPDNMKKFLVNHVEHDCKIQMSYHIEFSSDILAVEKQLLAQKIAGKEAVRDALSVFQTTDGECRRLSLPGIPFPYAMTVAKDNGTCQIWVDEKYSEWMQLDTIFVSLLALEKQMMEDGALIFHSAYMCYNNTAVLFSAPSETGKSTQADLWEKYRGTYTVNGDKALLIRDTDGWMAYGWPICGSSEICHNERYPIHAIVMLKQAKENKAYPLTGFSAIREVMEQITINTWDSEFQMKAMDKLDQLLREVPVYRLECDISEEAVRCLEELIG